MLIHPLGKKLLFIKADEFTWFEDAQNTAMKFLADLYDCIFQTAYQS
jgi:hypothetical protein